jgi:hypothetical protein
MFCSLQVVAEKKEKETRWVLMKSNNLGGASFHKKNANQRGE